MNNLHIKLPITKKSQENEIITILANKTHVRDDKKIVSQGFKLLIPPTKENEYRLTIGRLTLENFNQDCVFHAYADLAYDESANHTPVGKVSNTQGEVSAQLHVSIELIKKWCDLDRRSIEHSCGHGLHYAANQIIKKLPTHIDVSDEYITLIIPQ